MGPCTSEEIPGTSKPITEILFASQNRVKCKLGRLLALARRVERGNNSIALAMASIQGESTSQSLIESLVSTLATGLPWRESTGTSLSTSDTRTDTDGNHAEAKEPFRQRHALQLSALDESVAMTRRSSVWVAAAGLESRPTTRPTDNWRAWNRSKVPQLGRTIEALASITEPLPATLIIFSGGADYVSTVCEILDRAFADRANYVFANTDLEQYEETAERFNASTVSIMLPEGVPRATRANTGLRTNRGSAISETRRWNLPQLPETGLGGWKNNLNWFTGMLA